MNNETVIKEYINIVKGDVNQTGTVTMADVMKLADYLLDESKITEDYNLKAGDVNGTNTVTMADVMKLADYILKGGDLQ
jgi:2-keto-4-pentenoate hydratase/2-oxohepta-3-ene-1,7-dioic acid hydratase in catechol pathway